MAEQKSTSEQQDKNKQPASNVNAGKGQKTSQPGSVPKPESSAEAEGASGNQTTDNQAVEEKVETSSESGQ